jgi:hypothetical protein
VPHLHWFGLILAGLSPAIRASPDSYGRTRALLTHNRVLDMRGNGCPSAQSMLHADAADGLPSARSRGVATLRGRAAVWTSSLRLSVLAQSSSFRTPGAGRRDFLSGTWGTLDLHGSEAPA